jgi:hypothetical protein
MRNVDRFRNFLTHECILTKKPFGNINKKDYPNQKSVLSLSLGFIGIVTVSPPVMFSMTVELVALAIVELSLLLFE